MMQVGEIEGSELCTSTLAEHGLRVARLLE